MKTLTLTLAALTSTAVLAVGAPMAYASHGADDGGGTDSGHNSGHDSGHGSDDRPGHDAGDDHGRHGGADDHGRHGRDDRGRDDHGRDDRGRHGDRVVQSGTCSGGARWTAKVKADDGGLEVEGEVDSSAAGQSWAWSLTDNGATAAQGTAVTGGRSGSFSVERTIADRAGTDTIVFSATTAGQVCAGSVRF